MAERVDPTMLYYGKVYENICRKENINEILDQQLSISESLSCLLMFAMEEKTNNISA